jgi:hypothetical protein
MASSGPLKSSGGMPGKIRNPQQGLKELETLEGGGGGLRNSGTQQHSHNHEEERRMSIGTSFIVVVCSSIFALCLAFLIYGFVGGWQQQMLIRFSVDSQRIHIVHDDEKRTTFTPTLKRGSIEKGGVFEIWADDEQTLMAGLGYAHTIDRMVAMALTRIVVQGRLSELIAGDDPQALAVDTFMRKKGFYRQAKTALELISKSQAKEDKEIFNLMSSYSSGVNHRIHEVFSSDSPSSFSSSINSSNILDTILAHLPIAPVDLTLVAGIKTLDPWTPIDSLAIINLMSYLGLAEVQEVAELIILDVLQQTERHKATSTTPEELKVRRASLLLFWL